MTSTELIEYFKEREELLGEKATKWNMFLEGYGAGINDSDLRESLFEKVWGFLYNSGCVSFLREGNMTEEYIKELLSEKFDLDR